MNEELKENHDEASLRFEQFIAKSKCSLSIKEKNFLYEQIEGRKISRIN